MPEFKWIEGFLKATAWQSAGIGVACFLLVHLNAKQLLPVVLSEIIVGTLIVLGTVASGLAFGGFADQIWRQILAGVSQSRKIASEKKLKKQAEDYLPFMTQEEKSIAGYLLAHNQKSFTVSVDGGYASTLMGRGFVKPLLGPGQPFSQEDLPVHVPEPVWKVWSSNRQIFPEPRPDAPHPWRVPWQLR